MRDWNVVISLFQDGFKSTVRMLQQFGPVEHSAYHNVVLMKVEDPIALLGALEKKIAEMPALYDAISRVAPAQRSFEFTGAESFVESARSIVLDWLPLLVGRSFHVRLHRRGERHALRGPEIERVLDDVVLDGTSDLGTPARIAFADPDLIIAIDTVDRRAGIALWRREDLARYRLLRPD